MKELIFDIQRHRDATDVLYRGNRRWSGNFGRIWIEGSLIFDIESFECKVTMDREDVIIGQSKDSKIVGLTGEGTITVKRVAYSTAALKLTGKALRRGTTYALRWTPRYKIPIW